MDGSTLELTVNKTNNPLWKENQRKHAFTPPGIIIDDAFVDTVVHSIYAATETSTKVIDYLRQHESDPQDWFLSADTSDKRKLRIQYLPALRY
ncbi:hypothetical protein A2642_04135 [Candidatus Nomurabacteria bacterium RIFCSPHIGHO2_01_FULL_39_10]|uniref:Uncharacterized protein n=1 Tax=Candidatus Nomurabacteria bacterium RIFCSPHIGHO2_01_FULL_39_10 TaxID=1801733 RepID=A0A1F6V7R7_9BACT|nr:MAG: hypothetical protein A2642_04135 [Candidatus Nomurabacteria bacterium RIFCSPHIGHO2_01_FULL_39_10]